LGWNGREISMSQRSNFAAEQLPRSYSRLAICMTGLLALVAYAVWLMPHVPTEQPVLIIAAIFVAALVSSVAGFAFSAICGAMLFHLVEDPVQAIQIMMVCSVGGQAWMVWALRRDIVWRGLSIFLVGAAAGLPVGIFILLHATPASYAHGAGVLLVSYALFMVFRRPAIIRRQHIVMDAAVGFLGGITGGAAAFPGAFVTIWCGFKGWTKERQRGLYQPFILIAQLAAILVIAVSGGGTDGSRSFDFAGIAYLPAMLLGSTFGMVFFKRLNDRQFALIVNLLLIVSGLSFLI